MCVIANQCLFSQIVFNMAYANDPLIPAIETHRNNANWVFVWAFHTSCAMMPHWSSQNRPKFWKKGNRCKSAPHCFIVGNEWHSSFCVIRSQQAYISSANLRSTCTTSTSQIHWCGKQEINRNYHQFHFIQLSQNRYVHNSKVYFLYIRVSEGCAVVLVKLEQGIVTFIQWNAFSIFLHKLWMILLNCQTLVLSARHCCTVRSILHLSSFVVKSHQV